MSDNPDDAKRWPECKSTNISLESTRDVRAKRKKGETAAPPVVAKTLWIRCRRCQASWSILRRVTE
jgi:hypothetical protein